jgi:hypothetical protein
MIEPVPDAPPVAELDGRPIVWRGWKRGIAFLCPGGQVLCEACGHGESLMNVGMVAPDPRGDVPRLHDARWPTLRVSATYCPACGAMSVHDMGPAGDEWVDLLADRQEALF